MTDAIDRERWRRAWELCDEADGVAPAELDGWLAERCGGDGALETAVRELLDDGEPVPAAAPAPARPAPLAVGPYDLGEPIGSGGMGQVFRAHHRDLGREAAVKLLPSLEALDPAQAERFRREARLLASLDHPGIVRVFESGQALGADGRPVWWFAMELVEAPRTLTEYAREAALGAEDLVRLFVAVADAVAHAHGSGVLHRDLKPSNLLVDREGRAQVIDFGIAEAAGGSPEADLTRAGTLVGTLNYLAPERLDGERAEPRSDVYALGLVFEEAAVGRPRFDFSPTASGLASLRDAQRRPAPPLERAADVPPELGWIVAKATDPDPARRYADAGALAADLRRLERSEPLEAGPAGGVYRARLFVQRHRRVVAATAAILVVLAAGLVATATALVRESRALEREQEATAEAREALEGEREALAAARAAAVEQRREADANANLVQFFRGVFERAPARPDGAPPYSLDEALEDVWRTGQVVIAGGGDPLQRARVLSLVGAVFANRLAWDRAAELIAEADRGFEGAGATWTQPWLDNLVNLHTVLVQCGEESRADAVLERLLDRPADAAVGPGPWLIALNRAYIQWWRSTRDLGGLRLLEAIVEHADREDPGQLTTALSATHNLAVLGSFDDPERSLELYLDVWAWRSTNEPGIPRSYRSVSGAVEMHMFLGRAQAGVELADRALSLAAEHGLLESDPDVLNLTENRAKCLAELGRVDEAIEVLEQVLAARRAMHGDRDWDVLDTMGQLANLYGRARRWDESIDIERAALVLREEEQGPENFKCLRARVHIGLMEVERGAAEAGLAEIDGALPILVRTLGPLHEETIFARSHRAYALSKLGRADDALAAQRNLVDDMDSGGGSTALALGRELDVLCSIAIDAGDVDLAVTAGRRAVELFEALDSPVPRLIVARANRALALALDPDGEPSAARGQLDAAFADAERLGFAPPTASIVARVEAALATR